MNGHSSLQESTDKCTIEAIADVQAGLSAESEGIREKVTTCHKC